MKKINKGFESFFDTIFGTPNFSGDYRYNPQKQSKILGGLQPLVDMAKDTVDTVKPYKSSYYFWRDLLQPVRGLGNLVKGVAYLICSPFAVIKSAELATSWFAFGSASIVRGVTQVISTPLAWIRTPVRGLITFFRKKSILSFEENPAVQKLVARGIASNSIEDKSDICRELHRKFKKAISKNNKTTIDKKMENQLYVDPEHYNGMNSTYTPPTYENCQKYLLLFSKTSETNPLLNNVNYIANNKLARIST